jgi:hypothetical protein
VISIADPLDLDVLRIRHEFLSVPDLKLSPDQVVSLLAVSHHHAVAMLDALACERFLVLLTDGVYARCDPPLTPPRDNR